MPDGILVDYFYPQTVFQAQLLLDVVAQEALVLIPVNDVKEQQLQVIFCSVILLIMHTIPQYYRRRRSLLPRARDPLNLDFARSAWSGLSMERDGTIY